MSESAFPFSAGDCFKYIQKREPHLWVVISDPERDSNVLIVNLTTFRHHKDDTCILNQGDHPFVQHETCINYACGEVPTGGHLADLMNRERIKLQDRMSPDILKRIQDGALTTPHIPARHRRLLIRQLVPPLSED